MDDAGPRPKRSARNSELRGFDRHAFRRARIAADMTATDLARRCGVDRAAIHRWESGECLPLVASLSAAAEAMAIPLTRFLTTPASERTMADLRMIAGMTQDELAAAAGLTRRIVMRLEAGAGVLDDVRVALLADVLNCPGKDVLLAHQRSALAQG